MSLKSVCSFVNVTFLDAVWPTIEPASTPPTNVFPAHVVVEIAAPELLSQPVLSRVFFSTV